MFKYIIKENWSCDCNNLGSCDHYLLSDESGTGWWFLSEKAVSPKAMAALEAKYGLDKPLFEQYITYLTDALHGDFGDSLKQRGRTVTSIIVTKFPVSARVGGVAVLVALIFGIPLGCIAAMHRGKVPR